MLECDRYQPLAIEQHEGWVEVNLQDDKKKESHKWCEHHNSSAGLGSINICFKKKTFVAKHSNKQMLFIS